MTSYNNPFTQRTYCNQCTFYGRLKSYSCILPYGPLDWTRLFKKTYKLQYQQLIGDGFFSYLYIVVWSNRNWQIGTPILFTSISIINLLCTNLNYLLKSSFFFFFATLRTQQCGLSPGGRYHTKTKVVGKSMIHLSFNHFMK